jgi:hypothetical protein
MQLRHGLHRALLQAFILKITATQLFSLNLNSRIFN